MKHYKTKIPIGQIGHGFFATLYYIIKYIFKNYKKYDITMLVERIFSIVVLSSQNQFTDINIIAQTKVDLANIFNDKPQLVVRDGLLLCSGPQICGPEHRASCRRRSERTARENTTGSILCKT